MCWYERRLPIYLFFIDLVYSEEEKKAMLKDENGRELPQWLREAEEKAIIETDLALPNFSKRTIILSYMFNYGLKALLLYYYFNG